MIILYLENCTIFQEIQATKNSIANRKPVYGVGINDANYLIHTRINGIKMRCPFYRVWHNMLTRCYSPSFKNNHPTYKNCVVSKEWLIFSTFKLWMQSQEWEGKHLDKDIIYIKNKVYSPENCVFVPSEINKLLCDRGAKRGKYPQGVSLDNNSSKFVARGSVDGKRNSLGYFDTPNDASKVFRSFKANHITQIANQQADERIKKGLLKHAELLRVG